MQYIYLYWLVKHDVKQSIYSIVLYKWLYLLINTQEQKKYSNGKPVINNDTYNTKIYIYVIKQDANKSKYIKLIFLVV